MTCPACTDKRRHTPEETAEFHKYAGKGYTKEGGRTAPVEEPQSVKDTEPL